MRRVPRTCFLSPRGDSVYTLCRKFAPSRKRTHSSSEAWLNRKRPPDRRNALRSYFHHTNERSDPTRPFSLRRGGVEGKTHNNQKVLFSSLRQKRKFNNPQTTKRPSLHPVWRGFCGVFAACFHKHTHTKTTQDSNCCKKAIFSQLRSG